ncbi:hypothetical protein [Desulfosoma caldarium]|nr:hypothetical protein [Desulfosoma caldarium]
MMAVGLVTIVLGPAVGGWAAGAAAATDEAQPPMVTKHLFAPERSGLDRSMTHGKTSARVTFTGVMRTEKGKKALLETGTASKDRASSAAWYGEGDTVGPYVLKEIGANAVVLEGNGENLRLPLYGPEKDRPQPIEVTAGSPSKGQDVESATPQGTRRQQGQGQPLNPFGPAPAKGSVQGKGAMPTGQGQAQGGSGTSPLQQAIQKARQGQSYGQESSQNPFPPSGGSGGFGANPFMEMLKKKGQ